VLSEGVGYICLYTRFVYWERGIRVFVCLMCEVKAGVYVFMSMSDV
jgi:hypothetical protein